MDKGQEERGSEKLFAMEGGDEESLAQAIGVARGKFELKWWWKYGTPRIDHIDGGMLVKPQDLGATLNQFIDLNSDRLRVSFDVFPIGIVNPDAFQVRVNMRRPGQG